MATTDTHHRVTVLDSYSIRQGTMFRPVCDNEACGWEGEMHAWYGTAVLEGAAHTLGAEAGR